MRAVLIVITLLLAVAVADESLQGVILGTQRSYLPKNNQWSPNATIFVTADGGTSVSALLKTKKHFHSILIY
jgi:hypothetical protein